MTKIFYFEELSTTQDKAREYINLLKEDNFVVVAKRQTKARGRLNREWFSPEGGLWFTYVKKKEGILPQKESLIPVYVGVSVACEISNFSLQRVYIKWPNDILINNKKVCGILIEKVNNFYLIGVGINLNIREFPEELKDYACSLVEFCKIIPKEDLLLYKIIERIQENLKEDSTQIIRKFLEFDFLIDKHVKIILGKREYQGKVIGYGECCQLLLKSDEKELEFYSVDKIILL